MLRRRLREPRKRALSRDMKILSRVTALLAVAGVVATTVFFVNETGPETDLASVSPAAAGTLAAGAPAERIVADNDVQTGQEPVVATSGNDTLTQRAATLQWASTSVPLSPYDWPDPDMLFHEDTIYLYATNTLWSNVPYLVAAPGEQLAWHGDAFPQLPSWSEPNWTWAPSVSEIGDHFVLHYTARHTASGRQCIGVATASSPAGPFVDNNNGPLICALDQGGAIDASVIDYDGVPYLLWKNDGNCCAMPTIIYSQKLSADGTSLAGDPVELIRNDLSWEYDVVEGPSMVENGGVWHLFYAANRWDTPQYATGHARCATPVGPCVKTDVPVLATGYDTAGTLAGPGGMEVIDVPGSNQDIAIYHGWRDGVVGYDNNHRSGFIQFVEWVNGYPVLTTEPDLAPLRADEPTFIDVPAADWQFDSVAWMAESGVTTGCDTGRFCPDDLMSREQQLTFLWRYVGSPDSGGGTPFSDVPAGRYYTDAVTWAFNAGVTEGIGGGKFGTGYAVTRGQAVTFLWRQAGEPTPTRPHPFVDVPDGRYFSDAVAWAAEKGITEGISATEFAPDRLVTRVQFAAFLSRFDNVMN